MLRILVAVLALLAAPTSAAALELRAGVLAHDVGLFGNNHERGVDLDAELMFEPLTFLWAPRPHLGASINTQGLTSQAYAGLTWSWNPTERWFIDFSLGGAIHDGKLRHTDNSRIELGSRVLFRESLSVGWRLTDRHSISAMFAHISNARLASRNEGMDQFGLRWGYRF